MTATPDHARHDHGHGHDGGGHDGGGHDGGGQAHGSLRGYVWGFALSVVLTAVPFWLVMGEPLASTQLTGFLVVGLAVAQILVHMIFFLHMDPRSEGGWIVMSLIFTLIVLVIAVSGTLWVMYHLNANMMPLHDMDAM